MPVPGERGGEEKAPGASTKHPGAAPSLRLGSSGGRRSGGGSGARGVGGRRPGQRPGGRRGTPDAGRPAARAAARGRVRARPHQLSARHVSRGARVEGHSALTMELSEYVQKGFQMLADPGSFDSNAFTLLLRAAFQSLLDAQADEAVLGKPLGCELGRPGPRGAPRRVRDRGRGKPREEEVSGLCPALRRACGVAALPSPERTLALLCPQLAPAHSQLYVPSRLPTPRPFVLL